MAEKGSKEEVVKSSDNDAPMKSGASCGCEVLKELEVEAPDILASLPKEKRIKLVKMLSAQVVARSHSGPLPPPEDLALYNQAIPNGADRIMKMAEKQLDHRVQIETVVIRSQQLQSGRGQIFGFLIGIIGILAGSYVTIQGHGVVGGAIAGTTSVSLVYAFIAGQRAQRRDLASKATSQPEK